MMITDRTKARNSSNFRGRALPLTGALRPTKRIRRALISEKGLGTLEVVILIAVLIAIALIFNDSIRSFAQKLFKFVFDDGKVTGQLG